MQLTMIFEGSEQVSAHTLLGQIRPFTTNEVPVLAQLYFDSYPQGTVEDAIDVFVHPKVRGTGAGRALMQAALATLPEHRPVGLRVESDNEPAYALYRSLGFKEVTPDK